MLLSRCFIDEQLVAIEFEVEIVIKVLWKQEVHCGFALQKIRESVHDLIALPLNFFVPCERHLLVARFVNVDGFAVNNF